METSVGAVVALFGLLGMHQNGVGPSTSPGDTQCVLFRRAPPLIDCLQHFDALPGYEKTLWRGSLQGEIVTEHSSVWPLRLKRESRNLKT
jgi:hypothetical protein